MSSKVFSYPPIEVVPNDKVTVSFYACKAGKITFSFERVDSDEDSEDSDLGFVVSHYI